MSEEDSKEVKITYETLYEILRREKSKDELQTLDESFFRDVLEYLQDKTKMIQEAVGKFDLFSVEERDNTHMQLTNVRRILKELYERREKKILEMALNKSKTNSNIIDTSNLLAKEHELYNQTVKLLDSFRKDVLLTLFELKTPVITELKKVPEPIPSESKTEPGPMPLESTQKPPESEPTPTLKPTLEIKPETNNIKVKFLQKVDQFVDKELELYGPFEPEATAILPKEMADILINKGSAVEAE
ncbi:hypothetical protein KY333_01330 [Candidatus Woesearchaeota archaeon]|nr:hypothetical protein [Candidatus Woesearchaeota archaeon]MBW2994020.1 hypothetical protein [Candidatus Woesearchaeota archaeon]